MARTRIWSGLVGVVGATAVLAALAVGCGKDDAGGESSGGNAGSSGSGAGESSSGGAGGASSGGGVGGDSSGATGGTGGADATGGAAGEAGGESSGGSSAATGGTPGTGGSSSTGGTSPGGSGGGPGGRSSAGSGGSGGSSGLGGSGGSGGSSGGSAGRIGTLGEGCSPRGTLACAANHQKLTVLCGGDDTWQPNLTCGTGQFCDSTPGQDVGTCRPELPECAAGAGTRFCAANEKNLVTCSPDAVSTSSAPCVGACHENECRDADPCPVWGDYDDSLACSRDCGTGSRTSTCNVSCTGILTIRVGAGERAVVRTPFSDTPCTTCGGTAAYLAVNLMGGTVRVTTPEPWYVSNSASCTTRTRCRVFSGSTLMYVVSTGLEDRPVNVVFEDVPSGTTCPP